MKKKLKVFAVSFLLSSLPVGLASCGGEEQPSTQDSNQSGSQSSTTQPSTSSEPKEMIAPRFDGMAISTTSPLKDRNSFVSRDEASASPTVRRLDDEAPAQGEGEEPEPSEGEGEPSEGETPEGEPAGEEGDEPADPTQGEEPTEPAEGEEPAEPSEPADPTQGEEPTEPEEPKEDEFLEVPEDNMPSMPENADIEDTFIPSITVNEESNVTPFYAEVNQDVYISVRIVNPQSYAILRFTLNGVVYQSYQFESGSNSELLVLKVNAGAVAGIKEYTIDQIKYISDEDNKIRDCIIEGNQTVKLSVAYEKNPSAAISNESQNFYTYTASVNVTDPNNLVDFNNGECKLYFYDGEKVIKEIPMIKGINTFTVDNLELGKTYQYVVVANYDRLDPSGFSTHILLKRDVNTGTFVKLSNVAPTHDSVSFDYRVLNSMATVVGCYLFQDGEAIRGIRPESTIREFDGLLSNTKYELRVYYTFRLNGQFYTYYDGFDFTTKAHAVPSLNATFRVYEASVEYNVHIDDEEGIINLKGVKLYTAAGDFIANASYDDHIIEGLNRNTNYVLRFIYSYDLNDGNGEVEDEKAVAFSTTKAIPVVEIRPYRSTYNSLSFDLLVTDPNVVGTLNSIRLFDSSNNFIAQLNNVALREFTGLKQNTNYIVEVGYIYDLNDGNGSQIATFREEISTAKATPTVDFELNSSEAGLQITSKVVDNDQAGSIKSIAAIDGDKRIELATADTQFVDTLLSDHDYEIEFVYEYNLKDLTGVHEKAVTKHVHTVAKSLPQINVTGKNTTYSSFDLSIKAYDPSKVATIKNVKLSLGTLEIASSEDFENLSFDGLFSNTRYTVTTTYEYDLNDGKGLIQKEAVNYVSTLKRDDVSIQYADMKAGETSIDFGLKLIDKDNLIHIDAIELYDEEENLVASLDDLSIRSFENLEKESFYTIVTRYSFDLNDGKGVQHDSATILYGTSGSHIYVNDIAVLNNENPKIGDEVQVLVRLDNPHDLEITGIYVSGVYCPVLDNSSDKNTVIVKFVPDTEGGIYTVTVTGYEYVTSGVTLQQSLTSEYEEEILVMGEMKVIDFFSVSDTYYENYTTTPMRILEISNPTGYEITKLIFLNGFYSGDNNTYESSNFKMIDANHIAVFDQGIQDNGIYDLVLAGITYGLEGVTRNMPVEYLHANQGYYNQIVHIKDIDDLLSLGGGSVNSYNNSSRNLYILDADIDCDGIAWEGLIASGVFDGNGHTIKNIRAVYNDENNQTQYYGLFKNFDGIIYNLNVENVYFSIHTKGTVYAAGIAASTARVYDSSVKNSTFDIFNDNGDGIIAGVSLTNGYGSYSTAPRLSTNNYVENLVIKTNLRQAALVTDRNSYNARINGQMSATQWISLDAGGLASVAVGNSYIEKDGVKSYPIYLNDYSESALLYVNHELKNTTYHIHPGFAEVPDFDQEGYAINSINVTRDGYQVAWYDNPDFEGEPITFPYYSTEKIELYAKWQRLVLANPSYTYEKTSVWDETTQTSREGYVVKSFNLTNLDEDVTLVIGGYYKGLPVFGINYEAARELRRDADGNDDWDLYYKRGAHRTVYYLDTVDFSHFGENISAKTTYVNGKIINFNWGWTWYEDNTRSQLIVPKEFEDYYNNRFFKYETEKVKTFTPDNNPFDALDNLAPTDDENAAIKANITDAENLLESIRFDQDALPYSIEEGNIEDVRYMDYNGVRFALVGKNVYVGVNEIREDDTFRYLIYDNGEVVIDKLLNPNLQSIDLTKLEFTVNEIASGVFQNSKVRNIVLNEGLVSIGERAFAYSSLESVAFPSTLKNVGAYAFTNCQNLSKVTMNDELIRIRQSTFSDCYNLREVTLPSRLKYIENSAFYNNCISNLVLPSTLQSIGESAFWSWNTMTVFVPSSVKTMTRAFNSDNYNCTLYTSLSRKPNGWRFTWNDNDDNARLNVFYNIAEVKENQDFRYLVTNDGDIIVSKYIGNADHVDVAFEEGNVVQIGKGAFTSTKQTLKYVVLPATVRNLPADAISDMTKVYSRANNKGSEWDDNIASRTTFGIKDIVTGDDFIYLVDGNGLASIIGLSHDYVASTVNFDLGEGIKVVALEDSLFYGNRYITSVILPDTLQRIGKNAFRECYSLTNIKLPDSLEEIGAYAFANTRISEITVPGKVKVISERAFNDNSYLTKVVISEGVEKIENLAFGWATGLRSLSLPSTLQSIGSGAFQENNSLRRVEIPESVTSVGEYAFNIAWDGLIIHHGNALTPEGWNSNYFDGNRRIKVIYENDTPYTFLDIDANFDSSVQTLYEGEITSAPAISLYDGAYIEGWYLDPNFTQEATFPYTGEAHINRLYAKVRKTLYAYYYVAEQGYNSQFASGYGPLTVSEPGYTKNGYIAEWYLDAAFTKPVSFPLVIMENTTFYPKFVPIDYIEEDDFTYYIDRDGGKVLTGYSGGNEVVDLSSVSGLTTISANAFKGNRYIKKVIIPEGVMTISANAFQNCSNLVEVDLPSTLYMIGSQAFYNCASLANIELPEGLAYLGNGAFQYCYGLREITIPASLAFIEAYAFYNSGLREVNLNEGLLSIGESAFRNCSSLTSITLPSTLANLDSYAIAWTGIRLIEVPTSVTSVGYCALAINDRGTIIHHNNRQDPIGWNDNYRNQNDSGWNIQVIYEDGKSYSLLVIDGYYDSNVRTIYSSEISKAPTITLSGEDRIVGWYTDAYFTEEAPFPFVSSEHITPLYAKVDKYIYAEISGYGRIASGYNQLTIQEPVYERQGSYVKGWYYDAAYTREVSFPVTITESAYFYPLWSDIEYIEDGDFTYYLDRNGNKVLTAYSGEDAVVDLSELEDLIAIGASAFSGNKDLEEIIIPEGVTSIGDEAFRNCGNLEVVLLPDSLQSIGSSAFYGCKSLSFIDLPDALTRIGSSAFNCCSSLTEITIPSGVETIENNAFYYSGLTNVVISEGVKKIDYGAFQSCNQLYSIKLPSTLTRIESYGIAFAPIKTIEIPKSVTYVGAYGLRIQYGGVIVIHDSKKNPSAWDANYYGQSEEGNNTKVVCEDGKNYVVLVIDANFDTGNFSLLREDKVSAAPEVSLYNDRVGGWYLDPELTQEATFPFNANGHVSYLYAKVDRYIRVYVPNYGDAFAGYNELTFDEPNVSRSGSYVKAWYYDSGLTDEVTFPVTTDRSITIYPEWTEIEPIEDGDFTYYLDRNGNKILTAYSGEDAVIDLGQLDNLIAISNQAFRNNKFVREVAIPEGVTSIGDSAFYGCSSLQSVTLPSTLLTIGNSAFSNCSALTEIDLPASLIRIGSSAFAYCNLIREVVIPSNIKTIESSTFYNDSSLEKVVLPEGLTVIYDSAFQSCYNLKSVVLPSTLTRLGNYAFNGTSIKYIEVPESVTNVDYYALRIANNGVIVTHQSRKNPSAWSEDYYGQLSDSWNGITIIYENSDKYIRLVAGANYEEQLGTIIYPNEVLVSPSLDIFGDRIVGWYLDPEFTQEVTFPYAATSHLDVLYAKIEKRIYIDAMGIGTLASGFGEVRLEELPTNYDSSSRYLEGLYRDESLSDPIEYPLVVDSNTTIYAKWVAIEPVVDGDFTYYVDRDGNKHLTKYTGKDNALDLGQLENLVSIEEAAFYNNNYLRDVVIPEGVVSIGQRAFQYCYNMKSVSLPSTLKTIGYQAFYGNHDMQAPELPEGLVSIGSYAFWHEYGNTRIYSIPSTVIELGYRGIYGTYVLLPYESQEELPSGWDRAFCNSDANVIYDDGVNRIYLVVNASVSSGLLFYEGTIEDTPTLSLYSAKVVGWYLDQGLTLKASFPFVPSERLTRLYAKVDKQVCYTFVSPEGYYSNSDYAPAVVDEPYYEREDHYIEGWYTDQALTQKVSFPYVANEDVTFYPKWVKIEVQKNDRYYYYETDEGIVITSYRGNETVVDLSDVENLVGIGDKAFMNMDDITKVILPEGLTRIGAYAFRNCDNLQEIVLPSSLVSIGSYAFERCYGLQEIVLPNSLVSLGSCAFSGCSSLSNVTLSEGLASIASNAFNGCAITSITIPSGVAEIKYGAFGSCHNLVEVILPEGLKTIGESAFESCNSLKEITLPSTLKTIYGHAFRGTNIKLLYLPDEVTTLGNYALRINTNGVIITNHETVLDGWNSSWCGSLEDRPTVIKNNAEEWIVLVCEADLGIKLAYDSADLRQSILEGTGYTWYTTPDFQEGSEVTFTDGYFVPEEAAHITYLYGKVNG